jgi:hypothetical protein
LGFFVSKLEKREWDVVYHTSVLTQRASIGTKIFGSQHHGAKRIG